MIEKKLSEKLLRLEKGDVTDLEVDAFVFYAEPSLVLGSGYGTAITMRGGASVQEECKSLAPLGMGEAVITKAGEMKAKNIIHAVGPKFQEEDEEAKLRKTMLSTLKVADDNGIEKLAFPAMGSGFYGIPVPLCAKVMLETIQQHLSNGSSPIKEVIICVPDTREYGPFSQEIENI